MPSPLNRALGQTLRAIRKRLSLTQQDVAATIGTTRNHLYRMESGRTDPKLSMLFRLAQAFQLSIPDIMLEIEINLAKFRPKD